MDCPGAARCRTSVRGFTLIELAVVLAMIATLALVLIPSVAMFVNDSRVAQAHADCQAIADAIVHFYRDSGFYPQWDRADQGGPGDAGSRVQLLISTGRVPFEDQHSEWTTGTAGLLSNQLLWNAAGYARRTAVFQFGWNGPYLSSDIGPDPWGNRYVVNIGLADAEPGLQGKDGHVKNAVWVLTAGPNGVIETPHSLDILTAALRGDDIGVRIQ
jgi:prepilin-type N-terminal cleavage/methylation domain-containing protein